MDHKNTETYKDLMHFTPKNIFTTILTFRVTPKAAQHKEMYKCE